MAIGEGGMSIPGVRRPFRSLDIASSGLSGQRARIETIATNIANATSINPDGTPYQRKVVSLREVAFDPVLRAQVEPGTDPEALRGGVEVAGVSEVESNGVPVYDPSHPDADEDGYVLMPDISITDEMMDLMDANRLYEANATVFEAVKNMLRRSVQL
jgi:flagellar basal-body rod protein FlgC